MVIILETAVREIDKTVSHFPKYAKRFDVGPPGQEASNMIPTAYSA